ncbi:NUDIX domain-containing protein [Corynebacterium endometrii]|uniref:ADP-ribose pyrophosphatase n=1 Tax=Corynebacterium endometrii TaxID=2488819 RepID=A0A4V1CEK1_9CORY|nr:NUDIX hydrolase [Corynebacterium endometrii]QCB28388.1 ADP-ribose pyrophosphatase [Corynebacterium endometrii]
MGHTFEVTDSDLILDAPIIAVRRDTVRMPGGSLAHREVVEHFGAVAVAAVDSEGRIAMVKQWRQSVKRRLWELPAGLLDIKDEDPLECAKRELQEEAGLSAKSWMGLADLVTSPGFCEEAVRVYLATDLSAVERPSPADDEEADLSMDWVDLEEAAARVVRGEINNSIAVSGILAARAVLRDGLEGFSPSRDFDLRPQSLAGRRSGPDLKKG